MITELEHDLRQQQQRLEGGPRADSGHPAPEPERVLEFGPGLMKLALRGKQRAGGHVSDGYLRCLAEVVTSRKLARRMHEFLGP